GAPHPPCGRPAGPPTGPLVAPVGLFPAPAPGAEPLPGTTEPAGDVTLAGAARRHEAESDRRLVTVLFADVQGFTALSEYLDPETVTEIMNDCWAVLGQVVERYG